MYLLWLIFIVAMFLYTVHKGLEEVSFVFIVFMLSLFAPVLSAYNHYTDVGTIKAQHFVIEVYENKISKLDARLSKLAATVEPTALLNADSPVASITKELSLAEAEVAEAEASLAKAKKNIVTRKVGPFNFVTYLFEDVDIGDD